MPVSIPNHSRPRPRPTSIFFLVFLAHANIPLIAMSGSSLPNGVHPTTDAPNGVHPTTDAPNGVRQTTDAPTGQSTYPTWRIWRAATNTDAITAQDNTAAGSGNPGEVNPVEGTPSPPNDSNARLSQYRASRFTPIDSHAPNTNGTGPLPPSHPSRPPIPNTGSMQPRPRRSSITPINSPIPSTSIPTPNTGSTQPPRRRSSRFTPINSATPSADRTTPVQSSHPPKLLTPNTGSTQSPRRRSPEIPSRPPGQPLPLLLQEFSPVPAGTRNTSGLINSIEPPPPRSAGPSDGDTATTIPESLRLPLPVPSLGAMGLQHTPLGSSFLSGHSAWVPPHPHSHTQLPYASSLDLGWSSLNGFSPWFPNPTPLHSDSDSSSVLPTLSPPLGSGYSSQSPRPQSPRPQSPRLQSPRAAKRPRSGSPSDHFLAKRRPPED